MNKMNKTQENEQEAVATLPPKKKKPDISFASPFDGTQFNLRYIFFDEELAIDAEQTAIDDLEDGREKDEKRFHLYLKALVKFAFTDADAQDYDRKYAEFTAINQRIVVSAFLSFRRALNGMEAFM